MDGGQKVVGPSRNPGTRIIQVETFYTFLARYNWGQIGDRFSTRGCRRLVDTVGDQGIWRQHEWQLDVETVEGSTSPNSAWNHCGVIYAVTQGMYLEIVSVHMQTGHVQERTDRARTKTHTPTLTQTQTHHHRTHIHTKPT